MRRLTPAQWDAAQRRLENGRRQHEAMMNRAKCECGAPVMRRDAYSEWVHIGPCTLLRSKIDGIHCVGYDNMCDLIVGDFS